MYNTSRFTFSFLFLLMAISVQSQLLETTTERKSLTSGIRVGVDLAKYVYQIVEPAITGVELSVDYEVKENYYLVLEGGYEKAAPQSELYNYALSGYYGRVGFDYDVLKNTEDLDIIFLGLRYGLTRYNQAAENIQISNYWGTGIREIPDEELTAHWAEAVFGMKAELYFARNLFIGWTIRGRFFIGGNDFEVLQPYTIPGFGKEENKATIGATWSVFYNIPVN